MGMGDNRLCHAAHYEPREASSSVRPDDDQVRLPFICGVNDGRSRIALAIDFDDVMLTRQYDGRQAQSKLALVTLTFDLSAVLQGTGVTAKRFTRLRSWIRRWWAEAGLRPQSTVEAGAEAIFQLAPAATPSRTFARAHRAVG
jgi:hypothetical protein